MYLKKIKLLVVLNLLSFSLFITEVSGEKRMCMANKKIMCPHVQYILQFPLTCCQVQLGVEATGGTGGPRVWGTGWG